MRKPSCTARSATWSCVTTHTVAGVAEAPGAPLPEAGLRSAAKGNTTLHEPRGELDAQGNYTLNTSGRASNALILPFGMFPYWLSGSRFPGITSARFFGVRVPPEICRPR